MKRRLRWRGFPDYGEGLGFLHSRYISVRIPLAWAASAHIVLPVLKFLIKARHKSIPLFIISRFLIGPAAGPYFVQFAGCGSSLSPREFQTFLPILSAPRQSPWTNIAPAIECCLSACSIAIAFIQSLDPVISILISCRSRVSRRRGFLLARGAPGI